MRNAIAAAKIHNRDARATNPLTTSIVPSTHACGEGSTDGWRLRPTITTPSIPSAATEKDDLERQDVAP